MILFAAWSFIIAVLYRFNPHMLNLGWVGHTQIWIVWDVVSVAQNPYPYRGVIFPKIGTHIGIFFRYPFLVILPQKHSNFSKFSGDSHSNSGKF